MRSRIESGFTFIEVMIATGIAMTMILAVTNIQSGIVQENRSISQKMVANEYAKLASQILSDDSLCRCNTLGLELQPYLPATNPASYFASFAPGVPLCSVCPASGNPADCPADKILAKPGRDVGPAGSELPVAGVFVGDLRPIDATGTAYAGSIQIAIADDPNAATKRLVRPLQPLRLPRKFFVLNNRINGCGASQSEIVNQYGTAFVTRDRTGTTPEVVNCPAGMVAIGGGWIAGSNAQVPNCPDAPFAAAISSAPAGTTGWQVLLLCREYKVYVTCYRPNSGA